MKNIVKALAIPVLLASVGAHADIIGGSVDVSYWLGGYSGQATSLTEVIDLENDLNFDDGGFLEISASLEHPVPVLPNIRIKHIDLDETENGSIGATFDGIAFSTNVETNLDLTHSDIVLYYEILDNYVSVDIGLDVKIFDGKLLIQDKVTPSLTSSTDIDEIVPLLYVAAEVELPLTGLSVGADVSAVSYSGNSLYDAKARIRQGFGLAYLELGYRQLSIDIEDVSDIDVDAEISGVYLSTGLDF
mgnify:CR=1 FL=1